MRVTIAMALWVLVAPVQGDGNSTVSIVTPRLPPTTASGGEVVLGVTLDSAGEVEAIHVLVDTPPFTDALRDAVRQWRLSREGDREVLIAGVFRAPTLFVMDPLSPPEVPKAGPLTLPFPARWVRPGYPPYALGDGVVILAVAVGAGGSVADVEVVHSAPPFDAVATDAARLWRFRLPPDEPRPYGTVVYVVFGFRAPLALSGADRKVPR
jgi:TonB family protein